MRIGSFLPLIVIVLAAYFLFLRPQQARQRRARELASALTPGQRVMTTAGMFATVIAVDDDGVLLEIAPGVRARFVRAAISRVVEAEDPAPQESAVESADPDDLDDADTDARADGAGAPAVDLQKAPREDSAVDGTAGTDRPTPTSALH